MRVNNDKQELKFKYPPVNQELADIFV